MNDSVKDIKTLMKFMWEIYKIRFMLPIILDERDETDNKRNPYWSSTINERHGGQKMEESSIDKSNKLAN